MKHLFLLFAFAFLTFTANCQSFRFGVKGGANYADINGKDLAEESHRYKLGWHAGAMVNIQYPGNTWFSIQPEIIYSRKGYENFSNKFEGIDPQTNQSFTAQQGGLVHLNYLDVPVILAFRTGILVFELGPQFSYLLNYTNNALVEYTYSDGTSATVKLSGFSNQGIRKFDAGLVTGFRLETANGAGLGLRFNQGLIKLAPGKTDMVLAPSGCNQVFQLYASYLLPE
jgi:hypothetical protein